MEDTHKLMLIVALSSSFALFIATVALISCIFRQKSAAVCVRFWSTSALESICNTRNGRRRCGKEPMNNEKADPDQDFLSNAILDHRISDFYHPDSPVDEEQILKLSQLAMVCCSPSPSLRPSIKHICKKLEEIGSYGPKSR